MDPYPPERIPGNVVIVGAGISGLALACALRRSGREVIVVEASRELPNLLGGIFVHASGLAALRQIGLEAPVLAAGQLIRTALLSTAKGRNLTSTRAGLLERQFGAPSVALPRVRLQEILLDAVGRDSVRLGFDVATYEETAHGVAAVTEDGLRVEGDLLVGADGLRSRMRARLIGDGPPRYAGYTSWRGVAEAPGIVEPGVARESWGSG